MKTVTWTETYFDNGCGDTDCCGSNYYVWRTDDGYFEYNQEDCIRATASDHGLKDTSSIPLSLCEDYLKENCVELVFVYD